MQLEIILDHYKAFTSMVIPPIQSCNEKLKDIDVNDYVFNYGQLVRWNLIDADTYFIGSGERIYIPSKGITRKGIELVKTLINSR